MSLHLLLTIVDGFHYRYLVQTGIFELLLHKSEKLVVCCRDPVIEIFLERNDHNLIVSRMPGSKVNFKTSLHLFLRSCANRRLSETINIKGDQQRVYSPWRFYLRRLLGAFFNLFCIDPSRWLEFAWRDDTIDRLMHDHAITLVVLSTPGQKIEDLPYLEAARRLGIPTISPVYSWDNLTAKGPFVIPPNYLVVWNKLMKHEACYYHGFSPDDVVVSGVPVFDSYAGLRVCSGSAERLAFLTELGLDPSKKLLTLTTIPQVYYGSCHYEIVQMLKGWMLSGELAGTSLLIRPHPLDCTDYTDLVGPDVVVDHYGSKPSSEPMNWLPTNDNMLHLGRTMAFSDVVINIASTITVDAACFDTPTVNVAFDLNSSGCGYTGTVGRYYEYTHYKIVVQTGASMLVRSPQALVEAVVAYLEFPSRDSLGRAQLVRNLAGELDGQSWRRTAEAIIRANKASITL